MLEVIPRWVIGVNMSKIYMEHKDKIYKLRVSTVDKCDASLGEATDCSRCLNDQRNMNEVYCRGGLNLSKAFNLNIPLKGDQTYTWRLFHDGS